MSHLSHICSKLDYIIEKISKLKHLGDNTMETLAEYVAKQNENNAKLSKSLEGIRGDLKRQADLIRQLKESQGRLTTSDKLLLDDLAVNSDKLAKGLEDLDNENLPDPEQPENPEDPNLPVDPNAPVDPNLPNEPVDPNQPNLRVKPKA